MSQIDPGDIGQVRDAGENGQDPEPAASRHGSKGSEASPTLNAFSRVTASVGLMFLFGLGGSWLDHWLGSSFLTIAGFVIGGVLMLLGMLFAVKAAEFERKQLKEDRLRGKN